MVLFICSFERCRGLDKFVREGGLASMKMAGAYKAERSTF